MTVGYFTGSYVPNYLLAVISDLLVSADCLTTEPSQQIFQHDPMNQCIHALVFVQLRQTRLALVDDISGQSWVILPCPNT